MSSLDDAQESNGHHKHEDLCGLAICLRPWGDGRSFYLLEEGDYKSILFVFGDLSQEYNRIFFEGMTFFLLD